MQVSLGQMQVDRGVLKVGVAEEHLYGPEVGAVLKQMSRPAVAKSVGRYRLPNPGAAGRPLNGKIDGLCGNRLFIFADVDPARKQPGLWLAPAAPGSQSFQQLR